MTPVHTGEQLDHFRIEGVAARSGMASIFRATDVRTGCPVAIKVPHPQAECDPAFFERFQREEQIGLKLDHPGVMKVIANPERSRVYMAMEWVEGRLLRELLTAGVPPERLVRIVIRVCEALDHIHSHGVVHRDLKPENIMVGSEDRVKLIDFGIAGMEGARRLTFAKVSEILGTPDYISPEQVNGKRGDARSDIYALGIILYEGLTRRTPFVGPTPLAVMNDRTRNNPAPPREINPEISPEMQEIIYRALERDPRNRYATAREFAWDLQHQHEVGVAERTELTEWTWRREPVGKRLLLYAWLALIPVLIIGFMVYVAKHA